MIAREPATVYDWMDDAACAEIGFEPFFPEHGHPAPKAKRICATCPVIDQCLDYAVRNQINDGIWGGTSPKERIALRNQGSSKATMVKEYLLSGAGMGIADNKIARSLSVSVSTVTTMRNSLGIPNVREQRRKANREHLG